MGLGDFFSILCWFENVNFKINTKPDGPLFPHNGFGQHPPVQLLLRIAKFGVQFPQD
jgi:hypothetical protein